MSRSSPTTAMLRSRMDASALPPSNPGANSVGTSIAPVRGRRDDGETREDPSHPQGRDVARPRRGRARGAPHEPREAVLGEAARDERGPPPLLPRDLTGAPSPPPRPRDGDEALPRRRG